MPQGPRREITGYSYIVFCPLKLCSLNWAELKPQFFFYLNMIAGASISLQIRRNIPLGKSFTGNNTYYFLPNVSYILFTIEWNAVLMGAGGGDSWNVTFMVWSRQGQHFPLTLTKVKLKIRQTNLQTEKREDEKMIKESLHSDKRNIFRINKHDI